MADFPNGALPTHRHISTVSLELVGIPWITLVRAGPASAAWPAANRIFYVPLQLPNPFRLVRFWWANGSVSVSGNVEAGLYSQGGNVGGSERGSLIARTDTTPQARVKAV